MSCINVHAQRVGGISAQAHRIGGISIGSRRLGGINVRTSLICSIGGNYLRVTPTEIQWIDVNCDALYDIETNTMWRME